MKFNFEKLIRLVKYDDEKISFWVICLICLRCLYIFFIFSLLILTAALFVNVAISVYNLTDTNLQWQRKFYKLKQDYDELEKQYIEVLDWKEKLERQWQWERERKRAIEKKMFEELKRLQALPNPHAPVAVLHTFKKNMLHT